MGTTKLEEKISAKEYNKLLKNIELVDIFLKSDKSTLFRKEMSAPAQINFKEEYKVIELTEKTSIMEMGYSILAKSKNKRIFEVIAKYQIVFQLSSEIPSEFFMLYGKHSLPLQTFPYFRELVNSTISRMGLPPLILPLRKFLVGK